MKFSSANAHEYNVRVHVVVTIASKCGGDVSFSHHSLSRGRFRLVLASVTSLAYASLSGAKPGGR